MWDLYVADWMQNGPLWLDTHQPLPDSDWMQIGHLWLDAH